MKPDNFREFLTDVLIENREMQDRIREYENELDRVELANSVLKNDLEDLRSKPVMKWTPCAEELPMEGRQVLTCDEDGYMAILEQYRGRFNTFIDSEGEHHTGHEMNVVAWMPLPEPYKGVRDE